MAKINFKYEYGQKVLTPISERPGMITKLIAYTSTGAIKYEVTLQLPKRQSARFMDVEIICDESELTKCD